MIARNPKERAYYEARLKMQRDEQARLDAAEARGEARGQLIGRIQMLQNILNAPLIPDAELHQATIDQLAKIESDMQRQLRKPE